MKVNKTHSTILILLIHFVVPLFGGSLQQNDSVKAGRSENKFVPDTSYSGGNRGMVLPNPPPLDEIGPYVKQETKENNNVIYIICSVVLAAGCALYFFKRRIKKAA